MDEPERKDFSTGFADTMVTAAMADMIKALGVIEFGVDEVNSELSERLEGELQDIVGRIESLMLILDAQ